MPKNSALPKNSILKEKRVNDSFTDLASHFAQIFSERLRGLIVLFFLLSGSLAGQQITPGNPQPVTSSLTNSRPRLSRDATQVADVIGIAPLFDRLKDLPVDHPTADGASTNLEALLLRQEITEKVLAASLDVDSVNAIIDSEIEQIRATRSDLQSRRDKAQNIINVASIVTGGALGVVNTALQFNERTANLGNGIGVVGGAASVVLSVVGIHKQSGGRRDLRDSPRMLARFFGRTPDTPERVVSGYPAEIWSYLNLRAGVQPATNATTRREQLLTKWQREGRVDRDGTVKRERKIDALSTNIFQARRLNIEELNDRVTMLLDVRATVSLMKRDLAEILRELGARSIR